MPQASAGRSLPAAEARSSLPNVRPPQAAPRARKSRECGCRFFRPSFLLVSHPPKSIGNEQKKAPPNFGGAIPERDVLEFQTDLDEERIAGKIAVECLMLSAKPEVEFAVVETDAV